MPRRIVDTHPGIGLIGNCALCQVIERMPVSATQLTGVAEPSSRIVFGSKVPYQ